MNVEIKTVKKPLKERRSRVNGVKNEKKPLAKKLIIGIVFALIVGFLGKYTLEQTLFYNPLLGTWRTHTTMGIREIVFERGSMTSFGTKNSVTYDIKEKEVVVMDTSLQLGTLYTIIDKDTITTQMGKSKTLYKRVP